MSYGLLLGSLETRAKAVARSLNSYVDSADPLVRPLP